MFSAEPGRVTRWRLSRTARRWLRDITTGLISNGSVEITSGVQVGDMVITLGQNSVVEGGPVEVVNQ